MNKVLSIVVLLSALNACLAVSPEIVRELWKNFKNEHGKSYLVDTEETRRFEIFKKNVEIIEKHNADYSLGIHKYRLGINPFADWTFEEFKRNMLGTSVKMSGNYQSTARFLRIPKEVKLPDAVDWREKGAVTPVKNQGQCGSCWAFSTTGSLEAQHFLATQELVSLSEQQLVDCSRKYHNEGCNGGLMDNAFTYIKENGGLESEESYPYKGTDKEKCKFNPAKVAANCTGFVDLKSGDEEALQEAIATVGPVSVAIDVTEDKFMLYKDGVFVDDTCANGQDDLNHGVLVVGYGPSDSFRRQDKDDDKFWIVKNSWGSKWGEDGYIRMARNKNNMCGVATSASYPLVKDEEHDENIQRKRV